MRRWADVISIVQSFYEGSEPWHVNGDTAEQKDALDRVVVRITGASVTDDPVGYNDNPIDRTLCVRQVHTRFELWAANWNALEDRVHGLHIALRVTGESDLEISAIDEPEWLTDPGLTAGGACAVVTCDIAIPVLLASDADVLATGAPLNEGAPRDAVESAETEIFFNQDTDTPDLTITKEDET